MRFRRVVLLVALAALAVAACDRVVELGAPPDAARDSQVNPPNDGAAPDSDGSPIPSDGGTGTDA